MADHYVIIVAGGVGSRMQSTLPKQFLILGERPVLMHTISRFHEAELSLKIVVVLAAEMVDYWQQLCDQYSFAIPHEVVVGGQSRFQSVQRGLSAIRDRIDFFDDTDDPGLVAVHDAARPIIAPQTIRSLFSKAKTYGAVVPAVRSTNSIRIGNMENSAVVDRETVWQVQTPQVFYGAWLVKAYEQAEEPGFTDDASVVEKMGNTVGIAEGDHFNLKITHPEDLDIAQIYLSKLNLS